MEDEVRERRRAEEGERESRQHFTDAIESMSQGFVIYDATDRIIVANQRIKEFLPELASVLIPGTHFSDLVRAEIAHQGMTLDEQETAAIIAEQTALHHALTKHWDVNTGDERRLRVIGTRMKSGGIFELTTDITETHLAERALRQSEQRFQDFATSSGDWFWEMDADLRFIYLSKNIESIIGVPRETYYGLTRQDILGDEADSDHWRGHLSVLQRHEAFRDFTFWRAGEVQNPSWVSINGIPHFDADGTFSGYRGVGSDVTERMEAVEALRVSETRFQDFAMASADWFTETDADHRYTYISASITKFGFSPDNLIGKSRLELFGDNVERRSKTEDYVAMKAHRLFRNVERVYQLPETKWFRISGEPYFSTDRTFLGYRITGTDITELKEKEAALRASEERFQDFANISADWFAESDSNHVFTFMSDSVSVLGLTPADFLGRNRYDLVVAGNGSGPPSEELHAMQAHQPFKNVDRKSQIATGSWIRVSGVPMFADDGVFTGYRIAGADISELMQKETALRRSEQRFRDFADNASDWFWEMDKDLRFTWISGSVEKIIGVSAEWHYGKTRAEINLTNWDQPNLIDNRAVLERHEPYSDLLQHRQTPLGERWILSNGVPVFDEGGEFAGYFGSGRDVSALQQAEQTNLRFLDAIENLSEGVALYDAEDRLVICNARYGQLSGATEATLEAGKTFEEILRDNITSGGNPIANDDAEGWLAERLARRREPAGNFEMRHGDYELLINEDRLPDGSVVQTLRDITELKRNEQQLRQSQKMEAIGQLTGGVAHDFNNRLAVMMGNIALLDDELGDGHEYRDLTAPMARAVDQATRLTSRMLAFARLQPLDVGLVDVNALLVGMQPLLGRRLAEEIFVEMQLAPDLEPCIADQGQLEQAILNLAINACDAMPSGGNLIIKTENSDIPSALADDDMDVEPGPYVRITVMDQGHGISAEDQLRIFDPFFTTKEVGKGTGLGLSIVCGFVKQSNGHVTVDPSLRGQLETS